MLSTPSFPNNVDACESVEDPKPLLSGEGVGHNSIAPELDGFGANPWFVVALSLVQCLGEGVVYIVCVIKSR